MRTFTLFLLMGALLAGCSKNEPPKPVSIPAPTTSAPAPPVLTVTNPPVAAPSVSIVPAAPKKIKRAIQVKGAGNLYFSFPATWQDQLARVSENGRPVDTIIFRPANTNGDFQALIEVSNIGQTNADKLVPRDFLQRVGKRDVTNSVEGTLNLHDVQGAQTAGAYFVLTDKNRFATPALNGDYLYIMQGCAKVDGLILSFHLVCNRLSPFQEDMLDLIKSVRFDKK